MAYAIICDARKGESLGVHTLALVDRKKSRRLWWTSDSPNLILRYEKRAAADFACRRLRKNNPVVVDADMADRILKRQAASIIDAENERIHQDACDDPSWDAHKDWI